MSRHCFMVVCFLSVIYDLCQTDDTPLSLLIDLEKEYCDHISLCHTNASATLPGPHWSQKPCCFNCSCADNCYLYENCCPDKFTQEDEADNKTGTEVTTLSELSQNARFSCLSPQMVNGAPGDSESKSYYMIDSCSSNFLGPRMISKCKGVLHGGPPFYISEKNTLYKNIHCATCNYETVKNGIFLEPRLKCKTNGIKEIFGHSGPTSIIEYLRSAVSLPCKVYFEFPASLKAPDRDSLECSQIDISSCNVTGTWENYHAELEEACHRFYLPVQINAVMYNKQSRHTWTVFKNLACLKCNKNYIKDLEHVCRREDREYNFHVTLNYNAASMETQDNTGTNDHCKSGQFLDTYKGLCRVKDCPLEKYKVKEKCVPVFKEFSYLTFGISIKIYLHRSEIGHISENSTARSVLIRRIAKHFEEKFKICLLNIWVKNVNQMDDISSHANTDETMHLNFSYVAFNFVLIKRNADSKFTYISVLDDLEFLHDKQLSEKTKYPEFKFRFADHIFYDREKNKAIDLVDNVELVMLTHTHSVTRVFCPTFWHATEMHFCETVKLEAGEYNSLKNKIHLKHAGVYVYGQEFFRNNKNEIFVCLNKYQSERQKAAILNNETKSNNNKQATDTLDDGKTDKRNDTSLITKEFAFFIGCLALIALFVAIAFVKRKFLFNRKADAGPTALR